MAYPSPPGERLAYDLDGTKGFISRNYAADSSLLELSPGALAGLNSDVSSGLWVPSGYWEISGSRQTGVLYTTPQFLALLFPSATRIRGVFHGNSYVRSGTSGGTQYSTASQLLAEIQTSTDTTNGQDGSWTTIYTTSGPPRASVSSGVPGYAKSLSPTGEAVDGTVAVGVGAWHRYNDQVDPYGWHEVAGAATRNVKGIRFLYSAYPKDWSNSSGDGSQYSGVLSYLHIYGEPDTDASTARLEFVDATDETSAENLAWNDIHYGQVLTKTFKIRNLSPDKEAHSVELSFIASSPSTTPSPHTAMEFSLNGSIYSSTLSLSSIPPDSASDTIYVRLTVPSSGIIGSWEPRMLADVGEWI